MSTFTFERGLNKKGLELIDGYKVFLDSQTPSFVKDAIKKSILNEKALKVRNAVKTEMSIEEFTKIIYSYEIYLSGAKEMQEAAITFITNNVPADTKIDVLRENKNKVIVQKRIGLKSVDFQKYFGTSVEETRKLYDNGFAQTFVDTRIRKCIVDAINTVKCDGFDVVLSKCFKSDKRKLYNIAVNFEIPIDKLNTDICNKIIESIILLEKISADFTV